MTDYVYSKVAVYAELGGALRLARNSRTFVTDTVTGLPVNVTQGTFTAPYLDTDSTGIADFTATTPGPIRLTTGAVFVDVYSEEMPALGLAAVTSSAASAVAASASASAASAAASLVGAPADVAVAAIVGNPASATRVSLSSTYGRYEMPEAHGAIGDGTADDTAAVNAAIAAAMSAGGSGSVRLYKTYRCDGAIVFPFTAPGTHPLQRPCRITGNGGATAGNLALSPVIGGPILDLRYDGTDTLHPAKIDTRGAGFLEIDHITLTSGGTDNFPFFQTTNTTIDAHHNCVVGNLANRTTACTQDVFILGGLLSTAGDGPNAPFQGYGSIAHHNYFSNIRRGVLAQMFANSVVIDHNTFSATCGSGLTDGAAIESNSQASPPNSGLVISNNCIEIPGYPYAVTLDWTQNSLISGNSVWDEETGGVTIAAYRMLGDAHHNQIIPAYSNGSIGLVSEVTPGNNNWVSNFYLQPAQQTAVWDFKRGIHTDSNWNYGAGVKPEILLNSHYAANAPGIYSSLALSPNGIVTAPPGSIYIAGGSGGDNNGNGLWTKEIGTGNTGWAPVGTTTPIKVVTANYNFSQNDSTVISNGTSLQMGLPEGSWGLMGRKYTIKNIAATACTVVVVGGTVIDGVSSVSLAMNAVGRYQCLGPGGWYII